MEVQKGGDFFTHEELKLLDTEVRVLEECIGKKVAKILDRT
jgi:hypothetical protein